VRVDWEVVKLNLTDATRHSGPSWRRLAVRPRPRVPASPGSVLLTAATWHSGPPSLVPGVAGQETTSRPSRPPPGIGPRCCGRPGGPGQATPSGLAPPWGEAAMSDLTRAARRSASPLIPGFRSLFPTTRRPVSRALAFARGQRTPHSRDPALSLRPSPRRLWPNAHGYYPALRPIHPREVRGQARRRGPRPNAR